MSAKWRQSKQWDEQHLRGWALAPVRWILHALSSITLAVILLTLTGLYGLLASVPIGFLAQIPTWLIVGSSAVVLAGTAAVVLGAAARLVIPKSRRGLRFTGTLTAGLLGTIAGCWAWTTGIWPALQYDPATGTGLMLFADFVARYESTTLRRLPGIELTELEFYSAWPLRVILLVFVLNMIIATVRRIEFNLKNAGVLTVHAGIVVIALASIYYQTLKQEGDTILLAGTPTAAGTPDIGPQQQVFYDATRTVLWATQQQPTDPTASARTEQRRINGLPRYNAYGLDAARTDPPGTLLSAAFSDDPAARNTGTDRDRALSIDLPTPTTPNAIDPDINLRVVGYAPYAELAADTRLYSHDELQRLPPGAVLQKLQPIRQIEMFFPAEGGPDADRPVLRFTLTPDDPVRRAKTTPAFAFEMHRRMDARRWADLTTATPPGALDVLVVHLAAERVRVVIPARPGQAYTIGDTGWEVAVRRFDPEPPFPIITPGYEGASSSVAVLRITQPDGTIYDRWVYSRFPEISQDFLEPARPAGRPIRRDADPAIRVAYVDLRRGLDAHIDETTPRDHPDPRWRVAVRQPDGTVRTIDTVKPGDRIEDALPGIDLAIQSGWAHSEPIERPIPIPAADQEPRFIGTHDMAKVAVEVRIDPPDGTGAHNAAWTRVVWLPFTRYMGLSSETQREVELPDGRRITLAFGRLQRRFPGFALRLARFEMLAYDHRGAPRDYQSLIRVTPDEGTGFHPIAQEFTAYERTAKLNAPLRAPFVWDDHRSWLANATLRVTSGLNPNQYKISQAGWDQSGWQETQAQADRGLIPEPYARFTIMQVGNNPGIHVIALGGVMMALGIPWAFYIKPWMLRREKARLAAIARAGPTQPTRVSATE